jgi:hypothetical protein
MEKGGCIEMGICKDLLVNKLIGGSGGGGVSSWNDLRDKPFYVEHSFAEFLPETQAIGDGSELSIINAINGVQVGDTYTVKYNGVPYDCTAYEFVMEGTSFVALGDVSQLGLTGGNGEPFAMMIIPPDLVSAFGVGASVLPLDGATSATIAIYGDCETVHKLDAKYLPEVKYEGETLYFDTLKGFVYFDSECTVPITKKEFVKLYQEVRLKVTTTIMPDVFSDVIGYNGNSEFAEIYICIGGSIDKLYTSEYEK